VIRLAGYSYGTCIAFEMALQLQQLATTGPSVESLVLIDGSQSYVAGYADRRKKQRLPAVTENTNAVETESICAFLYQFIFPLAHSNEVFARALYIA